MHVQGVNIKIMFKGRKNSNILMYVENVNMKYFFKYIKQYK